MTTRNSRAVWLTTIAMPFFALPAWGDITAFSEDLESLDIDDTAALGNAGWFVFGNVFSGENGDYLFGYGPNPAPNDGAAFSAIVGDEGGETQGAQQLSVFSDYNNVGSHGDGDLVESNVYREFVIGATDVGKTYVFSFDAKKGNIEGATTAIAFIKTLDPNAGFFTTNFITVEMTAIPDTWGRFELSLEIDPSLENQLFQVGFANTASNFVGSGIFYDNIVLAEPADTDGDGVADAADNCIERSNADQVDSNGDGWGNACDADTNNDCSVNFVDLGDFKAVFTAGAAGYDADYDFTGTVDGVPDGFVNFIDLGRMKETFFNQGANAGPGPSACGTCQVDMGTGQAVCVP